MREAFQMLNPSVDTARFLTLFQDLGCYLVDLCQDPVDHLSAVARRAICEASEPRLARAIRRFNPVVIATVVRSIEKNVERAIVRAEWRGRVVHLPYPGRWSRHRNAFVEKLIGEWRS
jgi:hypothetical protein